MKNKNIIVFTTLTLALSLTACGNTEIGTVETDTVTQPTQKQEGHQPPGVRDEKNTEANTTEKEVFESTFSVDQINYENTEYKENTGVDLPIDGETTIDHGGIYILQGDYTGQLIIDTEEEVTLVLKGVIINSESGPAITVSNSSLVTISVVQGTENVLTSLDENEELNATIYANSDVVINGSGNLIVNSVSDGIHVAGSLVVNGTSANLNTEDDGFVVRDSFVLVNSEISGITSGDGIKVTLDEDPSLGYFFALDSTIDFQSAGDGIQATNLILLEGGKYTLETEGKGIKSEYGIEIVDGNFEINATDDAMNTNNLVTIHEGDFIINTDDDAIHADSLLTINNGTITIQSSYEGLESEVILINDGEIEINAADDGINVSNGTGGMPMNFNVETDSYLEINGGSITVFASGDGLDANGSIFMNDGNLIINGPTVNMEGSIDYDQTFEMSGGQIISLGSSGMAMTPSNTSPQPSIMYTGATLGSGITLKLLDSNGTEIIAYESVKDFQTVVLSNELLLIGEKYTLIVGEESIDFEITDTTTYLGEATSNTSGPGMRPKPGM